MQYYVVQNFNKVKKKLSRDGLFLQISRLFLALNQKIKKIPKIFFDDDILDQVA